MGFYITRCQADVDMESEKEILSCRYEAWGEGCQIQRWQLLRISSRDDSSRSAGASQVFLLLIVTV